MSTSIDDNNMNIVMARSMMLYRRKHNLHTMWDIHTKAPMYLLHKEMKR